MDWTATAAAGVAPEDGSPMQYAAEALRRRIDLYCRHLHGGVRGTLAIAYLRQIADDQDDLANLTSHAH
jgi:hypothetical protein